MKFAHVLFNIRPYSCFDEYEDVFEIPQEPRIPDPVKVVLFRKEYLFRHLNPGPLGYLQNLPKLIVFLEGRSDPNLSNIFFKNIFHALQKSFHFEWKNQSVNPPLSFIFNDSYDLNYNVSVFYEYLETGRSKVQEDKKRQSIEASFNIHGLPENDPKRKQIEKILEQETTIELVPIKIEESLQALFSLGEETITGLRDLFEGDLTLLDYNLT